jgi:DNA invertase Pin-like site-specific DNA recombinase
MNDRALSSAYADTPNIVAATPHHGLSHQPLEPDPAAGSRAVLYLRVSSAGQVNTDYDPEGISIPAQRVACERKAGQLDLEIIGEYVEPGRSGTEMTKRVAFQQLLERIRRAKDVDYVIVYELSRLARNRIDDAIVMADLRKRGVTLISATESVDATPVGQLMHGILAAFNEYRSAKDGADIAYKMGEKAKKGGTLGIAPIGYINTIDRQDGREIRSVAVDPERAPYVRQAFELYAGGEATIDEIVDELNDRGLTTRASRARPAGPISKSKVAAMLKDPYYLGLVKYKGQTYEGRHPPIIDQELFDRVQDLLEARGYAGERRRRNHHYLKGSLFCGRCFDEDGTIRRMIIQRATGRHGGQYRYYFCRGVQSHVCDAPYSNLDLVEAAVEDHYKTLRFTPGFISSLRTVLRQTLTDSASATRLVRQDLHKQLKKLDVKEDNLIDMAATGDLAKEKIQQRLRDIDRERRQVQERLDTVIDDLPSAERYLDLCIQLLEDPYRLYMAASDTTRRQLNQAIFKYLFVFNERVTGQEIQSPLAELLAADAGWRAHQETGDVDAARTASHAALRQQKTAGLIPGGSVELVDDLVQCAISRDDCSNDSVVREGGFEPPRP